MRSVSIALGLVFLRRMRRIRKPGCANVPTSGHGRDCERRPSTSSRSNAASLQRCQRRTLHQRLDARRRRNQRQDSPGRDTESGTRRPCSLLRKPKPVRWGYRAGAWIHPRRCRLRVLHGRLGDQLARPQRTPTTSKRLSWPLSTSSSSRKPFGLNWLHRSEWCVEFARTIADAGSFEDVDEPTNADAMSQAMATLNNFVDTQCLGVS